jgi:RHS repeat-associated protein
MHAGLQGSPLADFTMYEAPFRFYASSLGRWHSPDPAAGDITNPQSLNRYAYVLNNPTTLTDRLGLSPNCLVQRSGRPHAMNTPTTGCGGWYEGGGGISIDGGGAFPWGRFGAGGGGESAYLCPPGGCYQPGLDPLTGQVAVLEFMAGAGGATGWLSTYDVQQGLNEVDGAFLTNDAFQAYLRGNFLDAINSQLAAVIDALEARNIDPTNFINYVSENFSDLKVAGGNVDFFSWGVADTGGFDFTTWGLACPNGRCDEGALGTLDFSHGAGDRFHLDTGDPYTDLLGALFHLGVDVILGNTAYWVIPR